MRPLTELNQYRNVEAELRIYGETGNDFGGIFEVKYQKVRTLNVIASNNDGWDHVSVSYSLRPPSWSEMEYIKRMFFYDHEVAMQLHVSTKDHINIHHNVLHIWRPHNIEIPLPPKIMV